MAIVRPSESAYDATALLTRVVFRFYFRRMNVRGLEHVPPSGPLLVIANHPASITDVLVVGVAVSRRLHVLAHRGLFRPWPRGLIVRALGALPVARAGLASDAGAINEATFAACRALFDRGGAAVVFPEGRSERAHGLLPLRPGAARLALDEHARSPGRLTLLPVGIQFDERAAVRTTVDVRIGPPLDVARIVAGAPGGEEGAITALTGAMRDALAALIVDLPDASLEALLPVLEPLAREAAPGLEPFEALRRLASGLARGRADATAFASLVRRVRRYRRLRATLALDEAALRAPAAPGAGARLRRLAAAGIVAVAMIPGLIVNGVPWGVTAGVARATAPDATHIAFARMVAGTAAFAVWYAALVWGLAGPLHVPPALVVTIALAAPWLGVLALACRGWLARERAQLAAARAETARPRALAVLRERRAGLVADVRALIAAGEGAQP